MAIIGLVPVSFLSDLNLVLLPLSIRATEPGVSHDFGLARMNLLLVKRAFQRPPLVPSLSDLSVFSPNGINYPGPRQGL
jgi:hypothetical protein